MYDKVGEECGLFGIYGVGDVDCAKTTYYGLYALQHRGQESAGIAVNDKGVIISHKDRGLAPDVFNEVVLNHLKGSAAIGHVRYSMASRKIREDAQPLVTRYHQGPLATAYNGSLVDSDLERNRLEREGAIFQTNSDAEVINYLLSHERMKTNTIEEALQNIIERLRGGYSILLMSKSKLIAARDKHGYRPLSIGRLGESYVFASETCAFDTVGAKFVRDVMPGEIVVVSDEGLTSLKPKEECDSAICIFEYIYFARPDSIIEGTSVYEARINAGMALADIMPVKADIVIGVPDSGICAAIGYSKKSGIPYGEGLIKNRYIGRTFIQPTPNQREKSIDIKLNTLASSIRGKRVVMVDDSIVRGSTCAKLVKMLKNAGAKEVHMRISSPKFLHPCFFGTDIPDRNDLAAHKYTTEEMRDMFEADSLAFLSLKDLDKIAPKRNKTYCCSCFSGVYNMDVPNKREANPRERRISDNE